MMSEQITAKARPAPAGYGEWAYCPYQQDGGACYTNCALYLPDRQACAHLVQARALESIASSLMAVVMRQPISVPSVWSPDTELPECETVTSYTPRDADWREGK